MEPFTTTLRDGGRAHVRPLAPRDRARLLQGFDRLSPAARYLRFGEHLDRLTDEQVDYLMAVDGTDHVAWVAEDPDDPDDPGLGIARFIREPFEHHAAEAAVTVAEGQRGRGIGTLLLRVLATAALEVGVTEFRNYVLGANDAMLRVLSELGGRVHSEGRVLRVDLSLVGGQLDTTGGAAQLLRAAARIS